MPKVGKKKFSYTKKGKKAASDYAKKSGKKMQYGTTTKRKMSKKK